MSDINENVIDLGEWTVPTKWDDVTLKQFQDIERYYGKNSDAKFDVRDVINIMANKTLDEVNALPISFSEKILQEMEFIKTAPNIEEPTNEVTLNGETYRIHNESELKVGEYLAVDSALKDDKYNYAAVMGILCRKEGETYDEFYENEVLPKRIAMWENAPMVKVMPTVGFFLLLCSLSKTSSQVSSRARQAIEFMRRDIGSLRESGEVTRRTMRCAMKTLKRLEETINGI